MRKAVLLMMVTSLLLVNVYAQPVPHIFLGNVSYPEDPNFNLEGIEITAKLNGRDLGVIGYIKEDNSYEVEIPFGSGELIFYIGGVEAEPIFNQEYKYLGTTEANLEIHEEPSRGLCGNDAIDVGEQCDGDNFGFFGDGINQCPRYNSKYESGNLNCSSECKIETFQCILKPEPPPNNNNGNGGGSSGGGGNGGNPPTSNNQNDNPQDFVFLGEETSEDPVNLGESEQPQNSATFLKIIRTIGPFLVAGFLIGLVVASLAIRKYRKKCFTKE